MNSVYAENLAERNYVELIAKVTPEKFRERLIELIDTANTFITEAGFDGLVYCNERIMYYALLDYYSDVFRLKDFHGLQWIKSEKITAYTIAWILKRKPLQFIKASLDEIDIDVNERFCAELLLDACLNSDGNQYVIRPDDQDQLEDYINLMLYYFKYRECNPLVLELALESFSMGAKTVLLNQ